MESTKAEGSNSFAEADFGDLWGLGDKPGADIGARSTEGTLQRALRQFGSGWSRLDIKRGVW